MARGLAIIVAVAFSGLLVSCEASLQNPNDPASSAYKWQRSTSPNIVVVGGSQVDGAAVESWRGPLTVRIDAPAGSTVSYTLDGTVPTSSNGTQVVLGSAETSTVLGPKNASFTLRTLCTEPGKGPSDEASHAYVVYPLLYAWEFNDGDTVWESAQISPSSPFITLSVQGGMLHGVWNANTDPRIYSEIHEANPIDMTNLHFIDMAWKSSLPNGTIMFSIYAVAAKSRGIVAGSSLIFPAPPVAPTAMMDTMYDITDTRYNATSVAALWRSGTLQQLRVDPTNAANGYASGETFDIDYIRFYGDAQ